MSLHFRTGREHPAVYTSRRSMLAVLYEAQSGVCLICGRRMDPTRTARDQRNPMRPTVEHVRPLAFDGHDGPGNLAATHFRCNNRKGAGWPTDEELTRLAEVNARLGWDGCIHARNGQAQGGRARESDQLSPRPSNSRVDPRRCLITE